MDYKGQRLSEIIFHVIIILFGSIGWVIGYFREDFMVVFQVWFVGVVLSVIVSDGTERNGTERDCMAWLRVWLN